MLRIFLPRTTAGQLIYAPTGGSCALNVDVAPESAMQQNMSCDIRAVFGQVNVK